MVKDRSGKHLDAITQWRHDDRRHKSCRKCVPTAVEPRDELVEGVVERSPVMLLEVGDTMIARREALVRIADAVLGDSLPPDTEARSHHLLLELLFDGLRQSFSRDPLARVRLFH